MTKVDALGNKKTSKIWHNWVIGNVFHQASSLYSNIFTAWSNHYFYTSCPNREKVADFHKECKNTSKCGTTRLTGKTQITSAVKYASHNKYKIQVKQNLPPGYNTKYKCCTTCITGSAQITSDICPLYFLAKRQLVTDSDTSQDIE